jgi:polar amino acid transport system permease protein
MIQKETIPLPYAAASFPAARDKLRKNLRTFPWWLVAMSVIAIGTIWMISTKESYRDAFEFIKAGLTITITTTLISYAIAIVIGLITSLGRISNNVFFRNATTLYVELVRGIPMLVLIFFIALVGVPMILDGLKSLGVWLVESGFAAIGTALTSIKSDAISMNLRAIAALSITYGAFSAEIFRAGIQSISKGQMEAARSQGMSYGQAMRYVILPQAIRNVLPAIGNDFVCMLKDSSLVSVLAVRDITQIARLYAGRSFQFKESYITLAVMYLIMTVILSFLVKYLEKRFGQNERA